MAGKPQSRSHAGTVQKRCRGRESEQSAQSGGVPGLFGNPATIVPHRVPSGQEAAHFRLRRGTSGSQGSLSPSSTPVAATADLSALSKGEGEDTLGYTASPDEKGKVPTAWSPQSQEEKEGPFLEGRWRRGDEGQLSPCRKRVLGVKEQLGVRAVQETMYREGKGPGLESAAPGTRTEERGIL